MAISFRSDMFSSASGIRAVQNDWYRSACSTHQGRRASNEDAVLISSMPGGGEVVAIADGMGGHAAGDLASKMALERFVQELRNGTEILPAVRKSNSVLHETSEQVPDCRGMGTTLVALVSTGPTYQIVNVGDSRAYRIDGLGIQQITTDHSFVAEAVRSGGMSAEEAARSPWRNALTRSLGTNADVEPDRFGPFRADGAPHLVVLCSDGLYKVLGDAVIRQLSLRAEDGSAAVGMLSAAAYQQGSSDNISVAVVEFGRFFQPLEVPTEPQALDVRRFAGPQMGKIATATVASC
jgi:protein phosphatase